MDNNMQASPEINTSPNLDIKNANSKSKNNILILIIFLLLLILAFLIGYLISNSDSNSSSTDNNTETDSDIENNEEQAISDLDTDKERIEQEIEDSTQDWQTVQFTTEASEFSTLSYNFTYKQPAGDPNQNGDGFTYHTASGEQYQMQFESAYESYPEEFISFTTLEDIHSQFNTVYRALADEDLAIYKYSNDGLIGSGLDCEEEPFPGTAPCGSPALVYPGGGFRLNCVSDTNEGLEICDLIVGTIEVEVVE